MCLKRSQWTVEVAVDPPSAGLGEPCTREADESATKRIDLVISVTRAEEVCDELTEGLIISERRRCMGG